MGQGKFRCSWANPGPYRNDRLLWEYRASKASIRAEVIPVTVRGSSGYGKEAIWSGWRERKRTCATLWSVKT